MIKFLNVLLIFALLLLSGCQIRKSGPDLNIHENIRSSKSIVLLANSINTNENQNTGNGEINRESINTPVLIGGYFVGGLVKGKWVSPGIFYNKKIITFKNFEYSIYKDDKKTGTAKGSAPIEPYNGDELEDEKYDDIYCYVDLSGKDNKNVEYDIALKADWELFPRTYVNQNTDIPAYKNIVRKVLEREGLKNPEFTVRQIIRADLNGDRIDEVIITADNTKNQQFEDVKKGDNAVVIFRNNKDGIVTNQVVDIFLVKNDSESQGIYRILYSIKSLADLDGDGIMEVIIRDWYYEGEGFGVYKLIDNKLVKVAYNGFGA